MMSSDLAFWGVLAAFVFFALGWLAARIDLRSVLKQAKAVPESCVQALALLAQHQPEAAIHVLNAQKDYIRHNLKLMTTLGRLYRQRGEHDRAIRLHQNMLKDRHWSDHQRAEIAFELSDDFYRAGLVDRAEHSLQEYCIGTHLDEAAKKQLWMIYQRDRNWPKAIEYTQALMAQGEDLSLELAQFHCELAQLALFKQDTDNAEQHIEAAFGQHKRSVRASILRGDLLQQQGSYPQAIEAWQHIERQNPEYLNLVAERLMDAFVHLNQTQEGIQLLSRYCVQYPTSSTDMIPLLFRYIRQSKGADQALSWLREHIYAQPKLASLETLWEANQHLVPAELTMDHDFARSTLQQYAQRLSIHRCKQCNFKSRAYFWNCPACHGWESFSAHKVEF